MIISFAGNAGSGKSTVAEKIANALNWPRYYIGGLRRARALELGMTLEEYNKLGETDPKTDTEVDLYQTELAEKQDNFIIEGRTSWHFIPDSFKIFIDVDEKVGAQRIFNALIKNNERNETIKAVTSVEEMIDKNRERKQSDALRYQKYYNIDPFDTTNFDLVIDTTHLTPEETFNQVYQAILAKISQ
jgi:predicted cytidylate kinase